MDDPLPDRADLIDSTLQLAPLTLIDGSWLAGSTDYQLASSERGHFLFETYWDELGNGDLSLNHPLIYRAMLREMGIDLPPTRSPEFAAWPGFRDKSFETPVYWLSIGRFPRTFEAEILGLNLAMELSGVGGSYRRGRQSLEKYGFSTAFLDIHNTIDNVATGHSAWAADAIDDYLAQQTPQARPDVWDRIRAGYRSLNPPPGLLSRKGARRAQSERRSHA
ncbi:iron-containing redox enzyme family protein [Amycolatopsis sp. WGS_07]|uniref:iron-containing redox enzyme family protein n=1 Tax=Amycolatopsis sp. WGS_07 TaxID=3076764 RepID=UPI0038730360